MSITIVLTDEEADLLYGLLVNEAEFHRNDDERYSEMCREIAESLEPGGV
jgi:hypothetical protein